MPLLASSLGQNSTRTTKFLYEFLVTRYPASLPAILSTTMAPFSTRQLDSPTWSHPSRLLPSNRVTQPASWLTAFGAREPAEKPRVVRARARRTVRLDAIPMVCPHFLNFEFVDGAAARMDEIVPSLSGCR